MEKNGLERVSSPEELDKRLVVVGSKGWIALLLTCVLGVGAIFWAFFGSIPNTYESKTIYLNVKGFEILRSQLAGIVVEKEVEINGNVTPGQALVTVKSKEGQSWTAQAVHTGKAVDFYISTGSPVAVGDPLLLIQKGEGDFAFFSFISIERGEEIKVGKRVYIKPEGVKVQEYGSIEATVSSISPYVASDAELLNLLGNQALIPYFTQNQPVMIVTITPEKDPHSLNGMKWTSGVGPPEGISAQNVGTALFILEDRTPISYVMPLWKEHKFKIGE